VLDDVKPLGPDLQLGDFNFVTKKYISFISQLGYTGSGWQHRVLTEHLLHFGVINWTDISHTITATGHLPANTFQKPLEAMELAWREDLDKAKFSINSLIGVCSLDEVEPYVLASSTDAGDAPAGSLMTQYRVNGRTWFDFVTTYKQKTCCSLKPIYDICLASEARNVGLAIFALKHFNCPLLEFKTDSVMFKMRKRRMPDIATFRYSDISSLRQRYVADHKLNCYCDVTHNTSVALIFRMYQAKESDYMQCEPIKPSRNHLLTIQDLAWNRVSPQEAEHHEGGLLIVGAPGTGKSHLCLQLIARLRAEGFRVEVLSKTWVASQRIDGVTADHWVQRYLNRAHPM
jgi:hypothetical protein